MIHHVLTSKLGMVKTHLQKHSIPWQTVLLSKCIYTLYNLTVFHFKSYTVDFYGFHFQPKFDLISWTKIGWLSFSFKVIALESGSRRSLNAYKCQSFWWNSKYRKIKTVITRQTFEHLKKLNIILWQNDKLMKESLG